MAEQKPTHRKDTKFGFEFGSAKVTRLHAQGNYVSIRVLAIKTGKFVDISISEHGKRIHLHEGQMAFKDLATWLVEG